MPDDHNTSSTDFTRSRKLSLPKLVTFLLSLVAGGKTQGVDGKSGEFFKQARRSGLWPDADAVHRSAVTKARKKLSWRVFDSLLKNAVQLAYEIWPNSPEYTWHGMTVIAFDGSKYNLPASDEIRKNFILKVVWIFRVKGIIRNVSFQQHLMYSGACPLPGR